MTRLLVLLAALAFVAGLALPRNGGLLLAGLALVVLFVVPVSAADRSRR